MRPDAQLWLQPDQSRWRKPAVVGARATLRVNEADRKRGDADEAWREQLCELRKGYAALRLDIAALRRSLLARKAGFKPDQPRDDWGRWSGGEGTGPSAQEGQAAEAFGIGHNQGPPLEAPLDPPPEIPREEPKTTQEKNTILKAAAQWAARAARAGGPVGLFLGVMETIGWAKANRPVVDAYLDPPKSLEELQAGAGTMQRGYDTHHIVEQTSARNRGDSEELIESRENLVLIPRYKHHEINGWFSRPNEEFGGLSPREYLRDKGWEVRREIGLLALRKH